MNSTLISHMYWARDLGEHLLWLIAYSLCLEHSGVFFCLYSRPTRRHSNLMYRDTKCQKGGYKVLKWRILHLVSLLCRVAMFQNSQVYSNGTYHFQRPSAGPSSALAVLGTL